MKKSYLTAADYEVAINAIKALLEVGTPVTKHSIHGVGLTRRIGGITGFDVDEVLWEQYLINGKYITKQQFEAVLELINSYN